MLLVITIMPVELHTDFRHRALQCEDNFGIAEETGHSLERSYSVVCAGGLSRLCAISEGMPGEEMRARTR